MSQEEVDFLTGKKSKTEEEEMEEGKKALEGVLGKDLPTLPPPSDAAAAAESEGAEKASDSADPTVKPAVDATKEDEDDGEWLDVLGSGALRKKARISIQEIKKLFTKIAIFL